MEKIINYYKKRGQTPLDCIKELKFEDNSLQNIPITYAGRLDPLASGVLLLLIGDECDKKDEYLKLPKEYNLTILFGFSTDTYDLLGKIINNKLTSSFNINIESISKILQKFIGQIVQKYPPYSSRKVSGKPLFVWARERKLDEIEIPTHKVLIENIEITKEDNVSGEEILKEVKIATEIVRGDFRQKEILEDWQKEIQGREKEIFKTITLQINSGSGFYARGLAYDIGQEIGIPALAYEIVRTKVGNYILPKNNPSSFLK